jgi:phage recombination protein Bet
MIDGLEVVEHKEVAEVQQQKTDIIQPVDMKMITEFLDTTGLTKQLLPKEKATFVNMAQLFGLNPFKREIYCTVYGTGDYRTCAIVTGYEVYLKRAERTGKMDGWECSITGKGDDMAATVTIYRKDWGHPFKHTVYYRECVQINKKTGKPNSVWGKMPSFMTKKVAIAQAFRLCFPDEFGGMPYTNDEIVNDDEIKNMKSANVDATKAEPPVSDGKASEVFDNAVKSQRETMQEIRDKYDADIPETGKKLIDKALADEDTDDENFRVLIGRTRKTLENKGIKL